tara:strand:- start:281 stop:505 length:225 start_codon:yes stop_codon:yes gene_type:complete
VLGKPEVDVVGELVFNKYKTNGAGERIPWSDWHVIVENQFRESVFEAKFFKITVQEFTPSLIDKFNNKRNQFTA